MVTNTLLLVKDLILDSARIAFFNRLGFSDELENGELVSKAAKEAVQAIEAAVMIAAIMPAITAASAPTSGGC